MPAGVSRVNLANATGTLPVASLPALTGFSAHRNGTDLTIADNTWTNLSCTATEWNTDSAYNTGTYRFTPTAGKYCLMCSILIASVGDGGRVVLSIWKNGAEWKRVTDFKNGGTPDAGASGSCLVEANGTDYFEAYVYQTSGASRTAYGGKEFLFLQANRVI